MWGSPQLIDNFVFKQTNIVMSIDHYIYIWKKIWESEEFVWTCEGCLKKNETYMEK